MSRFRRRDSLNEYFFGFETLVFVTSGILSMHNQLVTRQISSYDPFKTVSPASNVITRLNGRYQWLLGLCEYILKCNLFLWCAAVFSASLLQSSASHDLQKSVLYADLLLKKHLLLLSMLKIVVLLQIFCGNHNTFFQHSFINREFKRTALLEK